MADFPGTAITNVQLLLAQRPKVLGSADLVEHGPTGSATGLEKFAGTVTLTQDVPTWVGADFEYFRGSGSVAELSPTASASGVEVFTATASVTNSAPAIIGSDRELFVGSCSVTEHSPTGSCSGAVVFSGSASGSAHCLINSQGDLLRFISVSALTEQVAAMLASGRLRFLGVISILENVPHWTGTDGVAPVTPPVITSLVLLTDGQSIVSVVVSAASVAIGASATSVEVRSIDVAEVQPDESTAEVVPSVLGASLQGAGTVRIDPSRSSAMVTE